MNERVLDFTDGLNISSGRNLMGPRKPCPESVQVRAGSCSATLGDNCGKWGARSGTSRHKVGPGPAPLARDLSPAGQHLETGLISELGVLRVLLRRTATVDGGRRMADGWCLQAGAEEER